jgi:hypothetical protein
MAREDAADPQLRNEHGREQEQQGESEDDRHAFP